MVKTPSTLTRQRAATPPRVPARPRRRPLLSRFSAAHGLMVLSGLLAFVLVAALTAERGDVVSIAVARDDIASGSRLRADDFERTELAADSPLVGRMVAFDDLAAEEWISERPIPAGDPLRRSDVRTDARSDGLRSVSIPIEREHAVGGALAVGDLVDVIDVVDGRATYAVTGAEVARVAPEPSSRGIAGSTSRAFYVVVLVDADGALAIAEALSDGKLEVVRSTGAEPVATTTTVAGEEGTGNDG